MSDFSLIDIAAVFWLFACWFAYGRYSESSAARGNLIDLMNQHRERWMMQMLNREVRIIDTQIVQSLVSSATFFASTSILILAGLFAVFGAREEVIAVVRDIPLAVETSQVVWEVKVIVMMLIFVHGFFKFAWSMRQFNYCALLIGAAPDYQEPLEDNREYAKAAAQIASLAAKHFNHGVRAYYFGMAALSWFLHPLFLFPATIVVVLVMYRREFRSRTMRALQACRPSE